MIVDVRTPVDAWAMLYGAVGTALDQRFGAEGRSVLRQSVRDYGALRGIKRKEELQRQGYNVNFKTLLRHRPDFAADHRMLIEHICLDEQRMFANVLYCPMAQIWHGRHCSAIGGIYCEEFYHAYFKAALTPKCQVNLTQTLTNGRDNICRFSCYLRPANLDIEQRRVCFESAGAPECAGKPANAAVKEHWFLFLEACHKNVKNMLGDDGLAAIRDVLRNLAGEMAALLLAEESCSSGKSVPVVVSLFGGEASGGEWYEPDCEASALHEECFMRQLRNLTRCGK